MICCTQDAIILRQGKYLLEIRTKRGSGRELSAPKDGKMTRTIRECAACPAEFSFYMKNRPVFRLNSEYASFEYGREGEQQELKTQKKQKI